MARRVPVVCSDVDEAVAGRIAAEWKKHAPDGVELLAGEEHYIAFSIDGGTQLPPMRVSVWWRDGRGDDQLRTRVLSLMR